MSNTLDIKRFGKVIKRDAYNFINNMGLSLIIILAIPVVIWLFRSLTPGDGQFEPFSRISLINVLTTIIVMLAPARLYKNCNDPRNGIGYAMLPASTLEKFLSMVFYCVIVTPIIYIAGALTIDTILTVIGGPYRGYAISEFFNVNEQIRDVLSRSYLDDSSPLVFSNISPAFYMFTSFLGTLTVASIFMFGNMLFKKRKTGKMLGIIIALFIILMVILINVLNNHVYNINATTESEVIYIFRRIILFFMNLMIYVEIFISALMLWGTYRKIKTQKY